jgi:phosphoglycerol transferase MdoB-like AlkP superfamily enzyme
MRKKIVPRLIKYILLNMALLLLLLTLYRLFLYFQFKPAEMPFSGKTFFLGLRYDLRVAAGAALPVFLLGSMTYFSPFKNNKTRIGWMVYWRLIGILLLIFFMMDYQYFAYRNARLDAEVLDYADDAAISIKMVWQSYPVIRILLILGLFIFFILFITKRIYKLSVNKFDTVLHIRGRLVAGIIFFFVLAFFIYGRIAKDLFPLRWNDAFRANSGFKAQMALNPVQTFFSSLKFRGLNADPEKVKKYYPYLSGLLQLPKPDTTTLDFSRRVMARPDSTFSRPNVVVVLCESFSYYKSSMAGNPLNATPFFDSLSRQGAFFSRCFTPAYGTAKGVWATLTGVPDVSRKKTASRNPRAVDQHVIVNDFKGYEKFYFLGGSASWANIRAVIENNIEGVKLYEEGDYQSPKVDVWGISDRSLFKEAQAVLAQQQKPFFAVIQTANNHRPYTIPKADADAMGLLEKPLDSLLRYGYNVERSATKTNEEYNAMRYMDFCIADFMKQAQQQPYFNNTIFLFIGDHGIRGDGGSLVPKGYTDKGLTCEHVPLLVYAPGRLAPVRHDFVCSQVDVLPTVAGLAGVSYRNNTLGRDLFQIAKDSTAPKFAFIFDGDTRSYGIIHDDYFFTRPIGSGSGKEELIYMGNTNPAPPPPANFDYKKVAEAVYETSVWWFFNNKK